MSRPAAPESPATEQCLICLAHPPYGDCAGDEACAYILTLERQLDLAQTEIKGHMRVEDELRATLAASEEFGSREHSRLLEALNRNLEAQARIAELGKDAARYRFLAEQHNDWHVERWVDTMRGSGTWQSIRGTALGNAIDAAIRSRA